MDSAGQEFLASAGLAMQEHGRASGRHNGNLVQHFAQRGTLADDVLEIVLRANLRLTIEGFIREAARAGKGCSGEISEIGDTKIRVPHTHLIVPSAHLADSNVELTASDERIFNPVAFWDNPATVVRGRHLG
jgi:hypothetical protein